MTTRKRQSASDYLSKREQQIMELIYEKEQLTAAELTELLPGDASNSTVRTLLGILEKKGKLRHIKEGGRFVYLPAGSREASARPALMTIAKTFFKGSISDIVVTLLKEDGDKLSEEEWNRLQEAIDKARSGNP